VPAADRERLDGLLKVSPVTRRSDFDRLKQPAKAASLSKFKEHLAYLAWADGLGPARAWVADIPPTKLAHLAGEARAADAADLAKVRPAKRLALLVCLLHQAQFRARDEVVTMFCKRMATITKRAKEQLERLREQHRADSERLLGVLGDVLAVVRDALGPDAGEGHPAVRQPQHPPRLRRRRPRPVRPSPPNLAASCWGAVVLRRPAHRDAASHANPSGSVKGPASLPITSRCDPVPSGETPATLARARRR
jgi:hypothetical protein